MTKKILIIDDEKEIATYLSRKLKSKDFETIVACDGNEALKIMAREPVDAVITDSVMSEMDGYTFCRKLKESEKFSKIPIVVCTAYTNDEKEFRKLGIDDYIGKPFKFDYLFESLDRIFHRVSDRIKFKKILVQADHTSGIESALNQIKEYGFRVDVTVIPEDENVIEEALRSQADIVVFNALQEKKFPETIITSLKSYVDFKDLKVILYTDRKNRNEDKGYRELLGELRERCLKAGADGWMGELDRENFLNIVFEYCKG